MTIQNLVDGDPSGARLGNSSTLPTDLKIAFFDGAPSVKATITGSRGANAALTNLLIELAAKGLIIDSTS